MARPGRPRGRVLRRLVARPALRLQAQVLSRPRLRVARPVRPRGRVLRRLAARLARRALRQRILVLRRLVARLVRLARRCGSWRCAGWWRGWRGGAAAAGPGAAQAGGAAAGGAASAAEPAAAHGAASGGASAAAAGPAASAAVTKDPHADPAFQAMKGKAAAAAGGAKAHAPAKAGAAGAQGAALPPGNDLSSQAQAAQVDEMAEKQPGTFDRAAFIAAVREAIDAAAPKNLEEADEFKEGGAEKVKGQVGGLVKEGKQSSEKDIKDATVETPDASKAKPKPVQPMPDEPKGAAQATVGAAAAMPPPVPAATTDLSAGPASVEQKMAEAEVTDEQLQKSNEPAFTGALDARDEAKEHAAAAPGEYRKDEKGVLGKAKADAGAAELQGLQGMQGARGTAMAQVLGSQAGREDGGRGQAGQGRDRHPGHLRPHEGGRQQDA